MFKKLFKKKKDISMNDEEIHIDKKTGEVSFGSNHIRVVFPDRDNGEIHMRVNGRSIFLTNDEFLSMYTYFSILYANMEK